MKVQKLTVAACWGTGIDRMVAQKICLTLSSFEINIRESFQLMREENSYCDVTLASEDGHTVNAHRVILAAGSEFFSGIIRQANSTTRIFLYLKGIKGQELENILDFLYNGQTRLSQEELDKFLVIAKELKIKGLEEEVGERHREERELTREKEEIINEKANGNVLSEQYEYKGKEEDRQTEKIKIEDETHVQPLNKDNAIQNKTNKDRKKIGLKDTDYEIIKEDDTERLEKLNVQVEKMMEKKEEKHTGLTVWSCKVCHKKGNIL